MLAPRFTLVMPDLRGYGDSDQARTARADHAGYSKRDDGRATCSR